MLLAMDHRTTQREVQVGTHPSDLQLLPDMVLSILCGLVAVDLSVLGYVVDRLGCRYSFGGHATCTNSGCADVPLLLLQYSTAVLARRDQCMLGCCVDWSNGMHVVHFPRGFHCHVILTRSKLRENLYEIRGTAFVAVPRIRDFSQSS